MSKYGNHLVESIQISYISTRNFLSIITQDVLTQINIDYPNSLI
jgi:hypothetical protein